MHKARTLACDLIECHKELLDEWPETLRFLLLMSRKNPPAKLGLGEKYWPLIEPSWDTYYHCVLEFLNTVFCMREKKIRKAALEGLEHFCKEECDRMESYAELATIPPTV